MAKEIKPDSNSVLLDRFSGTTKGVGFGRLTYGDSLLTLGQAINLTKGTYIKYAFSPWYVWDGVHKWDRNEAATGVLTQGTIEMWIKPRQYSGILNLNWNDVASPPPAGYILHLGLNAEGKLSYGVWGGHQVPVIGKMTIPLNKWTHIAVSWSPNGTKLHVNGIVDAYSSANVWPAFWHGTVFAYLNYWGETDLGMVDEFHISKITRTDEEIRSRVTVLDQVHPLENLPVIAIKGVGKTNTKRLEAHGVKTIKDMSLVDIFTLGKKTGISLFRLYMWRRKATLVMDVKIDRALFSNILKMQLGDIITMPDEELGRKTNQFIEVISDLKKDISVLLISLDNTIVRSMILEKLAT